MYANLALLLPAVKGQTALDLRAIMRLPLIGKVNNICSDIEGPLNDNGSDLTQTSTAFVQVDCELKKSYSRRVRSHIAVS